MAKQLVKGDDVLVSCRGKHFPFDLVSNSTGFADSTDFLISQDMIDWAIQLLENHLGRKVQLRVVDAMCGIGGDTISFSHHPNVTHITAMDVDRERYKCLLKNLEKLDSDKQSKVVTLNENFLDWIKVNHNELINTGNGNICTCLYMDAPWGGKSYTKLEFINDLYLYASDGTRLSLIQWCRNKERCVEDITILKLPWNFNVDRLKRKLKHGSNDIFIKSVGIMIFVSIIHSSLLQ